MFNSVQLKENLAIWKQMILLEEAREENMHEWQMSGSYDKWVKCQNDCVCVT